MSILTQKSQKVKRNFINLHIFNFTEIKKYDIIQNDKILGNQKGEI